MHCVAAEVAQKITVLFQHNNPDPSTGKQKRVHHAGGTAADNTDLSVHDLRHGPTLRCGGLSQYGCQCAPPAMSATKHESDEHTGAASRPRASPPPRSMSSSGWVPPPGGQTRLQDHLAEAQTTCSVSS